MGPLDLERIRKLIQKNHIVGEETVRALPDGEWQTISQFPELFELLLSKVEGKLETHANSYRPILGGPPTEKAPTVQLNPEQKPEPAAPPTVQFTPEEMIPTAILEPPTLSVADGSNASPPEKSVSEVKVELATGSPSAPNSSVPEGARTKGDDHEKTELEIAGTEKTQAEGSTQDQTKATRGGFLQKLFAGFGKSGEDSIPDLEIEGVVPAIREYNPVAEAQTVIFQRSTPVQKTQGASPIPGKAQSRFGKLKFPILILGAAVIAHELFYDDAPKKEFTRAPAIRPQLPQIVQGQSSPEMSQKLYAAAMKYYVTDTVLGYRQAAVKLLQASSLDINNVKALAMLASCYLNLIDSSEKDENYFSVISKLIEMSRAKSLDLAETIIADVEYFITANKTEAAQARIVEYTKTHPKFERLMFYYIAEVFYTKGDLQNASRFLSLYPDAEAFSPKVFYLRGLVAEKAGDQDAAFSAYSTAIAKYKRHALSHLKIAEIYFQKGQLKTAKPHLSFLISNQELLAPRDLARAYYLASQLTQLDKNYDLALGYVERAVMLDRDNHDYILEMYTLRARLGDSIQDAKSVARMYDLMAQGERYVAQGKYHEALTRFLEAGQSNVQSPHPYLKIGDMFLQLHDMTNARHNYELAVKKAEKSKTMLPRHKLSLWIKYIDTLNQSFDWEEAQKAIDVFRKIPGSQSAIHRLRGDMEAKQGLYPQALISYKRAMAVKESIDSDVYISYANTLMASKNYKDAPFFFALALRFDPLNMDAVIGTAKCVANSESIDRGITYLQDELQKAGGSRAELLSAIAELQIQKGEWGIAQQYVDQAIAANPEYPNPWRVQAQIQMNQEGVDKKAIDRALDSYKSYSDRNRSDPSGYLERYKLFIKRSLFEKAGQELDRIYEIYPKYPNLHYYKGALYASMGNHKVAVEEYQREILNNPNSKTAHLELGRSLLEIGDAQNGLKYLEKAMLLSPNLPEPKHLAAWANYQLKNYQGAVALMKAAISLDRGNPVIYKRLGIIYQASGDMEGAKEAFKKYLEMEPDAPDKAQFEKFL